jgi:hypothetical protein
MTSRSSVDRAKAAVGCGTSAPVGDLGTPEDSERAIDAPGEFGALERVVMHALLRGEAPADLADRLGLTLLGVRLEIKRVFARQGVHTRAELQARFTGRMTH